MSSFRNQLRPKHQVLVLKCYPKFQKNAADVKPNGSELSYLLYYASTRRSKIQKVGAYLEKKTDADVRKGKTGNVQVTLQILAALIDRTRRDLTLYAPYVLRILQSVLASKNLGLVEDSVATFQAFCEHQDVATFAADQYLIRLYEGVVKTYAGFASKQTGGSKTLSRPASFRWRTAGLKAIRSITRSDAISVDNGQQLQTILPPILENLYADSEDYVIGLYAKLENPELSERDPTKGRSSIATQRTSDTAQTTEGTTEEADRIAEEEVSFLALQCLKQIFSTTVRGQVRLATQSMLIYVLGVVKPAGRNRPGTANTTATTASMLVGNWATAVTQMAARWTPVQDRFVIMITIMEELVKNPVAEENLEQQLVLVLLVESLLSSSINMIGLSVMDVLLGLIQHILLLLQLGGRGSNILPHHQQTDAIDLFATEDPLSEIPTEPVLPLNSEEAKDSMRPSTTRRRLLDRLRICLGALANHIYYSDQVADMISAILLRLKPSPMSQVGSPAAAVENPEAAAQAISNSVNMQEDPRTDTFFSFGTARVTALNAIKEILIVANSKASVTGAGAVGRNRVQVQIWEGTQWLLRDEDRRVRRAYADALITWLRHEMSKNDLSVLEDRETRNTKLEPRKSREPARAVSSASRRSKASRAPKSTFLQLLHLAIYDNAIETPEDESEILLLHLLMHHLTAKLGVNSVQHGLPMIIRLQEDINSLDLIGTPKAKIVIGSLVHGYFWTLVDLFHFGNSLVAREILGEVNRRKQYDIWLRAIEMPPVPIGKIMIAGTANKITSIDPVITQTESLKPYDGIAALVNQIANAYNDSIASPPSSPPGSPSGKNFNSPILGNAITARARELPESIRDAMLGKWTKAGCLASIESELTRTGSIHGSQRGTLRSLKNGFLHADKPSPRDSSPGSDNLPSPSHRSAKRGFAASMKAATLRTSVPAAGYGQSRTNITDPRASDSHLDGRNVMRFEDLKRILDGKDTVNRRLSLRSNPESNDFGGFSSSDRPRVSMSVGSESMMDAEGLDASEDEAAPGKFVRPQSITSGPSSRQRVSSGGSGSANTRLQNRPRSSSTASAEDPDANARALKGEIVSVPAVVRNEMDDDPDAVPPVPPLPEGLVGNFVSVSTRPATNDFGLGNKIGGDADGNVPGDRRSNAQRILSAIDAGGEDGGRGLGRPPY